MGIGAGGGDAGEAGLTAGREDLVAGVVIDVAEAEEEGFHQLEGVVAVEAFGVEVALIVGEKELVDASEAEAAAGFAAAHLEGDQDVDEPEGLQRLREGLGRGFGDEVEHGRGASKIVGADGAVVRGREGEGFIAIAAGVDEG